MASYFLVKFYSDDDFSENERRLIVKANNADDARTKVSAKFANDKLAFHYAEPATEAEQKKYHHVTTAATTATPNKIYQVQAAINETVDVAKANIEKLIDRHERLDSLQTKTEDLEAQALRFKGDAKSLRRQMWWKNAKLGIIITAVCVAIVLIIILAAVLSSKH
jgi:vesicle-associated membrane protein 4